MSEIRVQFSGVVALGPGRPDSRKAPYAQRGPFHAVFPGCSRRECSPDNGDRSVGYVPVHWPVLMAEVEPGSVSGRPCDDQQGNLQVWYPMRERLIFEIDGKWRAKPITYQHRDTTPLDVGDSDLIADMRRIWKEKSALPAKAVGMKKNPKKVPREVAGQVFIPGGEISSSLGTKTSRNHVVFQPSRVNPPLECDIVSDAVITFDAKKKVTIKSVSLDTGDPLDSIIFSVKNDLTLYIANADPRDIRNQIENGPRHWIKDSHDRADADFELFYTVLAPRDKTRLPVPVDQSGLRLIRDCYVVMTER